jgi:ATP-dependent helicase IRC3
VQEVAMIPNLRPYQVDALNAIVKANGAGTNRVLIKKPTGTGKTVTFAAMLQWPGLATWLRQFPAGQRKMLVIAHREELLDQAADKIRKANPGIMVSIEQGDRYSNKHSDVIIASIQTLQASKFRRLKELIRHNTFRLVIVDEAHHAAAPSYRTALVHLGFLPPADVSDSEELEAASENDVREMAKHLEDWDARAPKDRLLVGVTATPNRSDAIGLGCVFQTIAYNYALRQAIDDGYLTPIVPWVIETSTSLDDVSTRMGEFNQKELADAVNNPRRNQLAVEGWSKYASERQTIAFTVDVQHAHDLADAFEAVGVKAAPLSGKTPKDERRAILSDFTAGRLQVVTNCMVLTEGTDLPAASCILHAKPTKSSTLYEQMTGRGLRPHPDDPVGPARVAFIKRDETSVLTLKKPDCIVIDVVDIARRHSLQTSPTLYGLPPNVDPKGKELGKFERELDEFREKYPQIDLNSLGRISLEGLLVRASTFDIWKIPELGEMESYVSFGWVKTSDDTYRIQYPWGEGTELVQVQPTVLGNYEISLTLRPADRNLPPRQRTLAIGYETAQAALGVAEAFIRQDRREVVRLKDKSAPWRDRPASPKQIALLRRLGAPIRASITMGQASDLIDLANARRAR